MTITQNGNSFTWTGTVTVTNATDITTGVATLMLTPAGGVGTLPFMSQGTPGLPPVFDSVTVTQVPYGTAVTAPVLTQVSPGGPGVASHYTLAFQVNQGQTGTAGTVYIGQAQDYGGVETTNYTLVWNGTNWHSTAQLCGDTFQATSFAAAAGNTTPQTHAVLTVPAQPFQWRPCVRGMAVPTGTANTHVDLRCLINNATSGQQVGYGLGVTGAGSGTIPAFPVKLDQAFGGAISGGYGTVAAGTACTFYFQSVQTAATQDSFLVPTSNMYFSVKVDPIPGTGTQT